MNIFVNARFLAQEITGTQRFAINLSLELKKAWPDTVFLAPPKVLDNELADKLDVKLVGNNTYSIYQKFKLPANLLWEQIDLPLVLRQQDNPPLLNLVNTGPFFYKNSFITIHDLAFKVRNKDFSRRFALLYNLLLPRLAHRARLVFTVSNFSKQELINLLGIPTEQITVIYNAVDCRYWHNQTISPTPLYQQPYILAVGSLSPRKNLARLITAFLALKEPNLRLVIVGNDNLSVFKHSGCLANELSEIKQNRLSQIIFTGYLNDQDLARLYRDALCFCYPSIYEGFGIPPLEAQAFDCPVLVSNRTALPEVFADSALYCNPEDTEDIKAKLAQLLNDESLRQKLILAGKHNIRRFSWQRSAKLVAESIIQTMSVS